ncbi:MAG TPA: Gfo/Idh/MocA family oxidoreductase [Rhizomicrobium sp.]|nr:Gfo/Idh/MocA family oxidoreductase [Rhizomicrobium sp.]
MTTRILIVGFGSIGRRHLRVARSLNPDADIRVLRHAGGEADANADGVIGSLRDALDFAPQAAVLASPAPFHAATGVPLLEAGVAVLAEKPLAASAVDGRALAAAAARSGAVLLLGYNLRYLPSLRRFREMVRGGDVGRVFSVRAEMGQYLPAWRPDSDYRQGVSARALLGGGVLLELSHEIDYLRWLFGDAAWVSATLARLGGLEIDVEDTVHMTLGFGEGAPVAQLDMDFLRHDTARRCTVIGETGTLRWDAIAGTVERFRDGGWTEVLRDRPERDFTYIAEWRHFQDCAEGRAAPLVGGGDGVAVLDIIEAARVSAREHRRCAIGAA